MSGFAAVSYDLELGPCQNPPHARARWVLTLSAFSLLPMACGSSEEEEEQPPDCDQVHAANPCVPVLPAAVDEIVAQVDALEADMWSFVSAGIASCDDLHVLRGTLGVYVAFSEARCGGRLSDFMSCLESTGPSLELSSDAAICTSGSDRGTFDGLAGRCSGTCDGRCTTVANESCAGTCIGSCGGKCSGPLVEGACFGQCTGACDGTCEMETHGACSGDCVGSCDPDFEDPVCNAGFWKSDQCVLACWATEADCEPAAVLARLAEPSDDAELEAALRRFEVDYSAVLTAFADVQLGVDRLAALNAQMSGVLSVAPAGVDEDVAYCIAEELPDAIEALGDAAQRTQAAVEEAAATLGLTCAEL